MKIRRISRKLCGLKSPQQCDSFRDRQLFFRPIQNRGNKIPIEFLPDRQAVGHAVHFHVARSARLGAIHDFRDGGAVGPAHDGVYRSANHQDRRFDALPNLAEIKSLQLLIEGGRAAILPVGRVVPKIFPMRMLTEDFAGSLALD